MFIALFAAAPLSADPCRSGRLEPVGDVEPNARLELERRDAPTILLAGVEPPVVRGGDADLAQAASEDLALWVMGGPLGLLRLGPEADRWGRALGRVFLANDDAAPHRLPSLSEALVDAGLARVDPLTESGPCLARLYDVEERARAGRRGLWEEPQFSIVDAAAPRDLTRHAGKMVIVQGRVATVRPGRGPTFINFGADSSVSVSLVVDRETARALERSGAPPAALAGREVRARGRLDLRSGPRIHIEAAGALEVLVSANGRQRPQ